MHPFHVMGFEQLLDAIQFLGHGEMENEVKTISKFAFISVHLRFKSLPVNLRLSPFAT